MYPEGMRGGKLLFPVFIYLLLYVSYISLHSPTFGEFILTLFIEVLILLYFLTFGRPIYLYEDYEYKVLTESMAGIVRAYNVNKHLGSLF